MKFALTQLGAALALIFAASGTHAAAVTGLTLADTIDASTGGLGADGKSGALRFGVIDPITYSGASLFAGDVNGGMIDVTHANPAGSFTTGFLFIGVPFLPLTTGAIDMDISGGVLTVNSLPWGGEYSGVLNALPPDADTLQVHNLIQTGAHIYAYRIGWSHVTTCGDLGEPTGCYLGVTSHWMLEGTMTTVPEPEAWAMLAAGLGLVGMAARRRRRLD